MKGLFIPGITAEMFRSGCLESIEALMSEGKIFDIEYDMVWIPVSEDLPKDEEIKLVTCKTKKGILNVNRAYYMDGHWHGSGSMSNVIAWMDPPEPYKVGDAE